MQKLALKVRSIDLPLLDMYSVNNGAMKKSARNEAELKTDAMTIYVTNVQKLNDFEFTGIIEYFTENNSQKQTKQIFSYLGHKNGDTIDFHIDNIFG